MVMGARFIAMASSLRRCRGTVRPCPPGRRRRRCRLAGLRLSSRRIDDCRTSPASRSASVVLLRRRQGGEDAFDRRALRGRPAQGPRRAGGRPTAAAAPDRDEWVSHCPAASLASLPGWPSSSTASKGIGRSAADRATKPQALPTSIELLVGEGEMPPRRLGADVARHQHRGADAAGGRHVERALQGVVQRPRQYGRTIPVVPRIDRPPSIPSRGLKVRRATSRPPGMAISTRTPRGVTSPHGGGDHPPRDGIDGRLAGRDLQPRLGHRAHAFAGREGHARRRRSSDRGDDLQPVGHVGVVAGVLADRGRGVGRRRAMAAEATGTRMVSPPGKRTSTAAGAAPPAERPWPPPWPRPPRRCRW